jgi:hypothetical protein
MGLTSEADSILSPALFGGTTPPDNGLGGKLAVRTPPRGGCGKALMLIVFLTLFPAAFTPGVVRNFVRFVVLPPGEEGRLDVEGARSPLRGSAGVAGVEAALRFASVGMAPVLLRVLVVGKAGSAVVGGP